MEIKRVPFQNVPQFSMKDVAYATKNPALKPFYKYDVDIEAFAKIMEDKGKEDINREVLVEVLKEQYSDIPHTQKVQENITALLQNNTFTITTAHQPSLATGPLYYIYKIASVIHLTQSLKAHYPNKNFVPIFVVGGEDHDFEEINHFNLFNKTITWENNESGAVGLMSTASLTPVLDSLKELLGTSPNATAIYQNISEAYISHTAYGKAAIHLTSRLFQDYGLVVLGMKNSK